MTLPRDIIPRQSNSSSGEGFSVFVLRFKPEFLAQRSGGFGRSMPGAANDTSALQFGKFGRHGHASGPCTYASETRDLQQGNRALI